MLSRLRIHAVPSARPYASFSMIRTRCPVRTSAPCGDRPRLCARTVVRSVRSARPIKEILRTKRIRRCIGIRVLAGLSFFFSAEVCHVPRPHAFACVESSGQQFAKRALVEFPVRKRRPVNLAATCAPAAQKDRGIGRAILILYKYRPILQRFKDAAAIPVCIGIRAVYCANLSKLCRVILSIPSASAVAR